MTDVKPEPRVTSRVCSLCGLDWKRHGKAPTTETCIQLLLGEVRALNAQLAHRPAIITIPRPYPVYPQPFGWPQRPQWGNSGGLAGIALNLGAQSSSSARPLALNP